MKAARMQIYIASFNPQKIWTSEPRFSENLDLDSVNLCSSGGDVLHGFDRFRYRSSC